MRVRLVSVLTALAVCLFPCIAEAKAILGIDLGSLYMKVALVQRGAPLEIVTNLHSKRKTEHLILFDSGSRFYGADASSLLARKPLKTPTTMSVMLGKEQDHPTVKVSISMVKSNGTERNDSFLFGLNGIYVLRHAHSSLYFFFSPGRF